MEIIVLHKIINNTHWYGMRAVSIPPPPHRVVGGSAYDRLPRQTEVCERNLGGNIIPIIIIIIPIANDNLR